MPTISLPANGSTIIFTRPPVGSYARPNEPYAVTVAGHGRRAYVHLECTRTGTRTADRGSCYAHAAFRTI